MTVQYASDSELGYLASATPFESIASMRLDEAYRLAHLPLVAPSHPDVIARKHGSGYEMGRHRATLSLVAPLDPDVLEASAHWRHLIGELRTGPLAGKLAWDILPKRRHRLHATLCGSLTADRPDDETLAACRGIGPIRVAVRGLFSGNINLGRLYLRLYPEIMAGSPAFHAVQRVFGKAPGSLFLAGMFNLTDHLDVHETGWLARLIATNWQTHYADFVLRDLWLLESTDDLVLDSRIVARVPLT